MSVTFPVSAEARARPGAPRNHKTIDPFDAIEKLARVRPEAAAANLTDLLPAGIRHGESSGMHGFVRALHESFAGHYPLILGPDDVWLAIAQGFAQHVNANAERLRSRLVAHQGKLDIGIRRDELRKGDPGNDWQGGLRELSDKVADHVGKKRDLLVGNFTTTGPVERATSELVLLGAMQSYFDYGVHTMCGIPEITLLGDKADWRSILDRAHVLAELDCTPWVTSLTAILARFVGAFDGSADPNVWKHLYKLSDESGGPYTTGFFNVFFPYFEKSRPNTYALGWETRDAFKAVRSPFSGPTTADFKTGLSAVPFKWTYYDRVFPMQFIGGFVGTHQHPETLAVRPAIGWGIADRIDE